MRRKVELGDLCKGDFFYIGETKYKVMCIGHIGRRDYNNVCCMDMETFNRKWFDIGTEVEVKE